MILHRDYNQENRLDRVWYESSNVFYSECEDKENELKTLRVVFKNGATYEYKDVDVNDYVSFVHGGVDGSNGRALNYFIKKYECKRIDDSNKEQLTEEMNRLIKEKKEKLLAEQEQQDSNEQEKTTDE